MIKENVEKNNGVLEDKDDFENYPSLQEVKDFLDKVKNINVDIVDKNEYLLPLEIENLKLVVLGYLDEVGRLYSKVNHVIEKKPIKQDLLKTLDERIEVVKKELLDVIEKHVWCNFSNKNCPTSPNIKEGGCIVEEGIKIDNGRVGIMSAPNSTLGSGEALTKNKGE